ncbi:hypothetical protein RhiirA4_486295 [Rhizophagus irregularis]|uniref:BAH domain-containing protein n=1 Tax=Rhizophagus irregularis TaxID=588596 RepID=A0A2I1HR74_9GLOM|nr:hypothetical protein RhiirA4_486295 [Rhizophagus irregularis]
MEVPTYNCGEFIVYKESITRNNFGRILAIVDTDGKLKVLVQRIIQFAELPTNLQSRNRRERSYNEVWLLDREMENAIIIIELQKIVRLATIVILYNEDNINNITSIFIREILYKHQGHWKLRNVAYSYRHPSEFAALDELVTNLPIYKLYIDLYYDDFGTFRNVYHSLGGVYVQIGNLPFDKRKQLKNHFVIGFVPFGGSFNEFIRPFVDEMKQLEKGIIMDVQGNRSFIIASLGDVTADLPQGNDLAGVKRHSAIKGCRTCNVTKDFWTSEGLDLSLVSRYHHITNNQFEEISLASNITRSNEIATMYGLRLQPSILDELKRERHLQSPQDVYHLTSGKVLKFLKITIEALSLEGKSEFIKFWKSFEYPRTWQKLPNPISHIDSFMMSDCLHLAMMIPFILNRFLKPTHFKKLELALFQRRTGVSRSDLAVNLWVKCWVLMARTMTIAFKHSFTEEDYIQLHECLDSERKLFSQAFEDFENLPNLHVNYHLLLHARNYATLLNTGIDKRFSSTNNALTNLPYHLKRLMNDWFIVEKPFDPEEDISNDEYISNIVLKKRIPKKYAEKIVPNDSGFRRELASVYQEMGYEAAFFESSCRYYELICFSVEDNGINTQYRLHVGDVVTTISEEEGETFALLRSIFSHKRNNQRFAFIVIDKFEITNQKKLECPVYRLRDTQRIRPISELDTNSTAHFIHYCNDDECISGSCHDFGNDLYIKNMYFFKAI